MEPVTPVEPVGPVGPITFISLSSVFNIEKSLTSTFDVIGKSISILASISHIELLCSKSVVPFDAILYNI